MGNTPAKPNGAKNPRIKLDLTEEQKGAHRLFHKYDVNFLVGKFGCLGKGTKVIMYDGSLKNAEDVEVGDLLMGPDSTPRTVLELKRGRQQMYTVHQNRGISYTVNEDHILSLKKVEPAIHPRRTDENGKRYFDRSLPPIHEKKVSVLNISVKDYLAKKSKIGLQGYIADGIDFEKKDLKIPPYYFGLWLADGSTSNIKQITTTDQEILDYLTELDPNLYQRTHDRISYFLNEDEVGYHEPFKELYSLTSTIKLKEKYIPQEYLTSSYEDRMELLSGIIDGDGYYHEEGKGYEIVQKHKYLSEQIVWLCRSLGFRTSFKEKVATMNRSDGSVYKCDVYRVAFYPHKLLNTKISRKTYICDRKQVKNPLHTNIKIEKGIVDDFYGFIYSRV